MYFNMFYFWLDQREQLDKLQFLIYLFAVLLPINSTFSFYIFRIFRRVNDDFFYKKMVAVQTAYGDVCKYVCKSFNI